MDISRIPFINLSSPWWPECVTFGNAGRFYELAPGFRDFLHELERSGIHCLGIILRDVKISVGTARMSPQPRQDQRYPAGQAICHKVRSRAAAKTWSALRLLLARAKIVLGGPRMRPLGRCIGVEA